MAVYKQANYLTESPDTAFDQHTASGIRWALEPRCGNTEHRFAKMLKPIVYERAGNYQSYGLKFFPEGLRTTDPLGHWIRKYFK